MSPREPDDLTPRSNTGIIETLIEEGVIKKRKWCGCALPCPHDRDHEPTAERLKARIEAALAIITFYLSTPGCPDMLATFAMKLRSALKGEGE